MKKHILSFASALLLAAGTIAQTFTLSPKTITDTVPCSGITAFQVSATNNGSSALYLSYTLISNTLPDTACWTQVVCDCNVCHPDNFIPQNDQCYTSIAASATNSAFMIFDVKDAKGHYGNGTIKYLVYETGNASNRDTLTINLTGCAAGIACSVGMDEYSLNELVVYPSLANNKIYIKNDGNVTHLESLRVYDMLGKAVYTEKNVDLSSGKKEINVSTLPAGIYFVEMGEGAYAATKKFVKIN